MTEPSKEAMEIWDKAMREFVAMENVDAEIAEENAALVIQEAIAERDGRIAELEGHHDEGWAQAKLKEDRIIAQRHREEGAAEERAKIVEWLWGMGLHNINDIADAIEAGEHLK
jgi:hypothetical protein